MFEEALDALTTRDLLERAAGCRARANRSDAELLECAQLYADRHHPSACERRISAGRERAVVLGGDGCPQLAEFAVAEFGVVVGVSPGVGRDLIADALALRHRFPLTWAQVRAGAATPWKARLIVRAGAKLDQPAAAYVDRQVAGLVDSITPYRLEKIVKAARMYADPDLARAEAEEKARERGVFVGSSDEHGTKTMYIKASSGAVIRLDARIEAVAEALKTFGDTRSLQHRRAEAVDIIHDPRYTEELLTQARRHRSGTPSPADGAPDHSCLDDEPPREDEAACDGTEAGASGLPAPDEIRHAESLDPTDPFGPLAPARRTGVDAETGQPLDEAVRRALEARLVRIKHDAYDGPSSGGQLRPGQTEVYVHLTDHTLATGTGVLRVEGLGPLLASQLAELIGHGPYTVKPVIDLKETVSVNAYEIPARLRERVKLIHPVELFPFGTRETSRTIDLDHIEPYDPLGPPAQTSTTNLAPLSRFGHRVKTHARGWNVHRLDHRTLEWTTPHGFVFEVGPTGTRRVPEALTALVGQRIP